MAKTIDSERLRTELLGMQRWEDEGGRMIEDSNSSADQIFVQPASIRARRRIPSLRWSEKFMIQPFQPAHGMILMSENMQYKPTSR